jgi:putative flippase GtrA
MSLAFLDRHPLRRELTGFLAVGCAAALTHLTVVTILVEAFGWAALMANVAAFGVAFFVSFNGHSQVTFPTDPASLSAARLRFFCVACSAFILNQTAFAAGLHVFGARYYLPILVCVLLLVATATYLASKRWAFAKARAFSSKSLSPANAGMDAGLRCEHAATQKTRAPFRFNRTGIGSEK